MLKMAAISLLVAFGGHDRVAHKPHKHQSQPMEYAVASGTRG